MRMTRPLLALGLAVLVLVPAVGASSAHGAEPPARAAIEPVLLDPSSPAMSEAALGGRVGLIVRLDEPSLGDILSAEAASRAIVGEDALPQMAATLDAEVQRRQEAPAEAIAATGAMVLDSFQVAFSGFLVEATLDQIPEIAAVPGVSSVRLAPTLTIDLGDTVPHIGATAAREELGFDGTGATIAIIDTGIDYTHAAFGGEGTREAFTGNNENLIEPGTFPTEKVIGGTDLAGQRYAPNCQPAPGVQCTGPRPDPDPLDPEARAHGTHVASIAAGMATDEISAGVAPGANLIALKVFGNPVGIEASTQLSNSAIEWVMRANLAVAAGNHELAPAGAPEGVKIDVINLSLGSDWGGGMVEATDIINRALESGVTVVASAGNDSNFPYITGSPSSAELALSVANTYAPNKQDALIVEAAWDEDGEAQASDEMGIEGASSGDDAWLPSLALVGETKGQLAWYGLACNDATGRTPDPAQDLEGKIALIERGSCAFFDKIWNAQRHGAIGALVFSDARPRTIMGCGAPSDCANGPSIPGVMIERGSGLRLLDLVYERELDVTVSLDAERTVSLADTISPSSSRGPSRHLSAIKPQISAPGELIMAARSGTGTGGEAFSGTSMSGPAVAGVAALLWQRNYDEGLGLQPLDISALIMNYASPVIHFTPEAVSGRLVPVTRQGAGLVAAARSAAGMTVVRSQRGIAGLSYGNLHTTSEAGALHETQTLTARNLSDTTRYFRPEWRFAFEDDTGKGVDLSFEPELLKVDGNWTAELDVTLTADPASLRRMWQLRGTSAVRNEGPFREHEIDGYVSLTEVDAEGNEVAGGDVVGVPFHSLPRNHSCVTSGDGDTDPFVLESASDAVTHTLDNQCNVDAPVEIFTFGGSDPTEPNVPAALDIESVGVRSYEDDGGHTVIEFAIRTRGTRRIAQDGDARIYIDLNRDGVWDKLVFSRDAAMALGPNDTEANGRWFIQHMRPSGTGLQLSGQSLSQGGYYQPFDIDETVTRLLVSADDPIMGLGLDFSSGQVTFDYAARIVDRVGDYGTNAMTPVHDDAPDGWTDLSGPRFTFRQADVECLTLYTEDGQAMRPGQLAEFTLAAGQSTTFEVWGCTAPDGAREAGLFLNFPANEPGDAAAQIRAGQVERNQPTIYMPYNAKDHAILGDAILVP